MTDTELLQALSNMIDTKLTPIKHDLESVKQDIGSLQQDVGSLQQNVDSLQQNVGSLQQNVGCLQQDMDSVKKTTSHLRKEMIKMQAMDEAILDEVERVHDILDKHTKDTSKHTAYA